MGERRWSRWTGKEDFEAIRMYLLKFSLEDIGRKLGRTPDSVRNRIYKLGVSRKRGVRQNLDAVESTELSRELSARGWILRPPGWLAEFKHALLEYGQSTRPEGIGNGCENPKPVHMGQGIFPIQAKQAPSSPLPAAAKSSQGLGGVVMF